MNKKKKIIIIILIATGIILLTMGYIFYKNSKTIKDTKKGQAYKIENKTNLYINEKDEEITIEADKIVSATGFSGASNYKYYLKGNTLYFRNISSKKNKEEILAYNINNIYRENNYIIAEKLKNAKIIKENEHLKYKEIENDNTYKEETQNGEEITIEAEKLVSATGFSGASNYKYYLKGTTLYFRNVSDKENKEEILAYNVEDLYLENNEVTAVLSKDGSIIAYNQYINYIKNMGYNNYTFNDQRGNEITIEAEKLISATGFSGSSNYKYYIKDNNLYFRNISSIDNKEELLANNVRDIYVRDGEIIALLSIRGKIIKENEYINYKK